MKKYQFWLQRKTYSQHLNNLLRIKLTSSLEKLRGKTNLQSSSSRLHLSDKLLVRDKSSFCLASKDISYIITSRQLQNHKMRLVRSNQIVRQNQQMVKRLNNIKPFVSNNTKLPINNDYKLKRKMQHVKQKHDKIKKQQNYKQFLKVQNQNVEIIHKYKLIVIVEEHQLILSNNKETEIFIELTSNLIKRKSQNIKPSQLNNHIFKFPLTQQLPEACTLNVHQYKNLDHSIIASYSLKRPQEGTTQEFQLSNSMGYNKMKVKIRYMQLKHKFHNLNIFKI